MDMASTLFTLHYITHQPCYRIPPGCWIGSSNGHAKCGDFELCAGASMSRGDDTDLGCCVHELCNTQDLASAAQSKPYPQTLCFLKLAPMQWLDCCGCGVCVQI